MRLSFTFFIFTLLLASQSTNSTTLIAGVDISQVTKEIIDGLVHAWNVVEATASEALSELPRPLIFSTEKRFFTKIETVTRRLDALSVQIDTLGINTIQLMLQNLPDRIRLELRLNDLLRYHKYVENAFVQMQEYLLIWQELENSTLRDFADSIVSHGSNSVFQTVENIYTFVEPSGVESRGILELLSMSLKEVESGMLCKTKQSPQQVLFSIYDALSLTQLKGYAMMQFAYMLKKFYGEGNFKTEAELAGKRFQNRTKTFIDNVRGVMEKSSTEMWRCDPREHVLGKTYEEITQLLQGYVENEVDLNPTGVCSGKCESYSDTRSHSCFHKLLCQKQRRCYGKIINCQFIESHMKICPADPKTHRRYDYIEYESGRQLGRKEGSCKRETNKVHSWFRGFYHCSYCFCLCDEESAYSDRYINLRPVTADLKKNMVVTGLRFVKHNKIIHLQIQEGKLLHNGIIDLHTVRWVPVEDYQITDADMFEGYDYHTLTSEKRAIDLDDLKADDGHIVTGVKFSLVDYHIHLEILTTPFDFESGTLIDPMSMSVYKSNANNLNTYSSLKKPRTEVVLTNPDVPTRSPQPSLPDSKSNQYIKFINSDIEKDAAQTTVPFLDAQPVDSLKPVPLGGAGIFHKGRKHFGGFIAPKVFTYDFSKHLHVNFNTGIDPRIVGPRR